MRQSVGKWLVVFTAISLSVSVAAPAAAGGRPPLSVSAPAFGCPANEGAFVVILDPSGRMLLLSGAEFLGGHRVGQANGEAFRVALPHSSWELARVGSRTGPVEVWGAAYRASSGGSGGCVAFDREQFSSEGDLVTYAQWLVNEVYLKLPKAERESFPALRLADRVVRLRVQPAGYQSVVLQETEGATMALRVPGGPQTLLLRPFVLNEATGRVAIELSITDQPYWEAAEKRPLGFVVASATEPAALADPAMTIQVEPATTPPANSNPPS
jgi:hypothetical protein